MPKDTTERLRNLVQDAKNNAVPSLQGASTLAEIFEQSPILFDKTSQLTALNDNSPAISGIGLSYSTRTDDGIQFGVTKGLPIDVMGYLATIGQIHKDNPDRAPTIFLIADFFAENLPGINQEELEYVANQQIDLIRELAGKLIVKGTDKTLLECLDIRKVSEDVATNQDVFDAHYRNLAHHDNDYKRRQTAAIAMYREVSGAKIKVSYAFKDTNETNGHDERHFDHLSREYEGTSDMSFAYVDVGRTLDTSRPRACPYIATDSDKNARLLIGSTRFVDQIQAGDKKVNAKTGKNAGNARKKFREISGYYVALNDLINATFDTTVQADRALLANPTRSTEKAVRQLEGVGQLALKR